MRFFPALAVRPPLACYWFLPCDAVGAQQRPAGEKCPPQLCLGRAAVSGRAREPGLGCGILGVRVPGAGRGVTGARVGMVWVKQGESCRRGVDGVRSGAWQSLQSASCTARNCLEKTRDRDGSLRVEKKLIWQRKLKCVL